MNQSANQLYHLLQFTTMQNIKILPSALKILFALMLFSFTSCESDSDCDEESLFRLEEATGTMVFLPCYNSWAIHIEDPEDGTIIGASQDIAEEFQQEDLMVCADACFHKFDLPNTSIDPTSFSIIDMYVIQNFRITGK